MITETFLEFESEALKQGFDEVIERTWDAHVELGSHTHPFGVKAIVVQGEMWLTVDGLTRHLRHGDTFELASRCLPLGALRRRRCNLLGWRAGTGRRSRIGARLTVRATAQLLWIVLLAACGGGGDVSAPAAKMPAAAPVAPPPAPLAADITVLMMG